MCLLAIHYQTSLAPILVAANREERFDRPASAPQWRNGPIGILCGIDQRAGGTWLGINQYGLLIAVTNRPKSNPPANARSRGALCLDLLSEPSAPVAAEHALRELETGNYAGANFVCLDPRDGIVLEAGDVLRQRRLEPGLHVLTNGDLNDFSDPRQRTVRDLFGASLPDDLEVYLRLAAEVCRFKGDGERSTILLRAPHGGTVSSSLIALPRQPAQAVYQHSAGPPDESDYVDYSPLARQLLAGVNP